MEMVQNDQELRSKLLQMKEDSILTDIMISCGKVTFSAHKCILSASSLFFKLIFADDMSKPQPYVEFDQLNMDQISVEGKVLESVVDFMYSGSININMQNFKDIVILSDYLVMQDLCRLTLKFLQKKLNKDNCLQFYLPLCSHELSLGLSQEILMMIWQCVENFFFSYVLLQEEMLEVPAENLILILTKGIRKNFSLINVLVFVHKWIEVRQAEEDLDVVEHFINLCIDLQPRSSSKREKAQIDDESILVLQNLITAVDERQNGAQDSTVSENIRFKLQELDNQLKGHSSCNASDGSLSQLDKDSYEDATKHARDNKDLTFTANSDTFEQNTLSKGTQNQDEVNDGTADSHQEMLNGRSPTYKHYSERILEESVQERVEIFLQGQIAYTHVTPKVIVGKSKVAKSKTRLSSKDNCVKKHSIDVESRSVAKRSNSETNRLVKATRCDIKYNLESSLVGTADTVAEQIPWKKRTKIARKDSEKVFSGSPAKRRKTMKTFQDFVTNLEDMDSNVDRNTEKETRITEDTFSHIADVYSDAYLNREQEEFDGKGNGEMCISDLRKTGNYRNENEKFGANSADNVIKENKNLVCKKKDKAKSGEDNNGLLNISEAYRDLLLQKNIPDTCILCKNQFTRGNHLVRHLSQVHKDVKTLNCGKCGEGFEDAKLFVAHSRTHFTEVEEKLVEEITDLDEIEYKCKVCYKQFNRISSIKAHIGHHKAVVCKTYKEETEIYKLPDDGKDDSKDDFKDDSKDESIVKVPTFHPCDLCEATFKRRDHLQRHVICLHSDVSPFSCEICKKTFKLRYLFTKHMATHRSENVPEKSILCDICGATFTDQAVMRRHVKRHTEKRHKCAICNKTYSQSVTLQVHMRKHSGVKPFQCEICSMLFAVKSNLLRHQRRHRGEKRYECDKCGKGFLMAGDLKRHYTTHTGEKNYACKYCGKRFNCRSKVPQHERIHTGEKPYSCRICGKGFIQSGDRKRHEATHRGKQGEGNKRRLTLYEIANPDESSVLENSGVEQNKINSHDQKNTSLNNIEKTRKNSEMDKQFKSSTYDIDETVNSIIDYAIKNREDTFSRGQFSLDKSGDSFQDKSSLTNENEAFIQGSDMFALMKSQQNSSDFIVQSKSKGTDQDLKVVVVQNTPPSLSYESLEVSNQAFYLPKEQN